MTEQIASRFNKSLGTNLAAALCAIVGFLAPEPWRRPILNMGLFALSGAITNWLAIYKLFEKVPGLYGSGVIPARFEDFKRGIHSRIMEQFLTAENLGRFLHDAEETAASLDVAPLIDKLDLSPAFDALIATVVESSFGNMLNMVGGPKALEPLREPFAVKMRQAFNDIAHSAEFQEAIHNQLEAPLSSDTMLAKINDIVRLRLDELTPQMVKDIIQRMIHEHLGWLVLWGGVSGALIGLLATLLP
jgi:uncharacterized membrane protein YheB (UPF0754 family)